MNLHTIVFYRIQYIFIYYIDTVLLRVTTVLSPETVVVRAVHCSF